MTVNEEDLKIGDMQLMHVELSRSKKFGKLYKSMWTVTHVLTYRDWLESRDPAWRKIYEFYLFEEYKELREKVRDKNEQKEKDEQKRKETWAKAEKARKKGLTEAEIKKRPNITSFSLN